MARPGVPGGVHRRLVERWGDDAVDHALPREATGLDDEAVGAVPRGGAQLPHRNPAQRLSGLDQLHGAGIVPRRPRLGDQANGPGVEAHPGDAGSHGVGVPDPDGDAPLAKLRVPQQRLGRDLRPDACDVSEGHGQHRTAVGRCGHGRSFRTKGLDCSRSTIRSKASDRPKPPDLVTTRRPSNVPPTILPTGTPGASAASTSIASAPARSSTAAAPSPPTRTSVSYAPVASRAPTCAPKPAAMAEASVSRS